MRKMLIILTGLTVVLIIAGCTSPTTNTTLSPIATANAQDLSPTLNAHFTAHYTLLGNFTRMSWANDTPVYSGLFKDANGTFHSVSLYPSKSNAEAPIQFEAQRAGYVYTAGMRNTTVNSNTSTHWSVTTDNTSISGWLVQPNTVGPFGLSLNVPYVLVSQDMKPMMSTESAVPVTRGTA